MRNKYHLKLSIHFLYCKQCSQNCSRSVHFEQCSDSSVQSETTQFLRWSPQVNIASFRLETESVICQQSTVARLYHRCDNDPNHGQKPHCCGRPRNPCTYSSVCHADKCRRPRNPCTYSFVCHADKRCRPRNPYMRSFSDRADKGCRPRMSVVYTMA